MKIGCVSVRSIVLAGRVWHWSATLTEVDLVDQVDLYHLEFVLSLLIVALQIIVFFVVLLVPLELMPKLVDSSVMRLQRYVVI